MNGIPLSGRGLLARSLPAIAVCVLAATPDADAFTYYVAPTGSDASSCSSTAPCRQIRRGLALAGPGDTVLVANGDYLGFDVRDRDGAAGAPITIKASGANARVLKTTDRTDNRDTIFITYSSYIVIDGLRSFSANRSAVRVSSSPHVTIRNSVFGSNYTWGIFTDFSDDLLVENNECYGSQTQHGIYVSNSGDRPVVRGNRVHDNRASGIQLNADVTMGGDGLITGAVIENNVIYNNGAGGGAAINLDGVQSSTVRNNILYNNYATGIVNYKYNGAQGPKGMEIVNNTVVQAATGRWAMLISRTAGTNRVRNNILYHSSTYRGSINFGSATDVANTDSDYNVITRMTPDDSTVYTLAQWQQQGRELHSVTATPATLFVNATGNDFRLRAGSPAINRGASLTTCTKDIVGAARPAGAAWDLGAYEGAVSVVTVPGPQAVVWTAVVGATVSGSSLTKTAANAWANSGGISSQQFSAGDGYVEVTATDVANHASIFGLSRGNTDANYNDVDFGIHQRYGQLLVYEAGTLAFTGGAYAVGDKLRVAVSAGVVRYSRNGTVFYTSKKVPAYPLLLDAAIYRQGSTLGSAIISLP
jgi:parallel beta-helix repeat protein